MQFIVPVKLTDCVISHPEIKKLHTVNYFSDRSLSIDKLLKTFGVSRPQKPTDEFFKKLEGSLTSLLSKAEEFHRLESAVEKETDEHNKFRNNLINLAQDNERRFNQGDPTAYNPGIYFQEIDTVDQVVTPQIWDEHEQVKAKKNDLKSFMSLFNCCTLNYKHAETQNMLIYNLSLTLRSSGRSCRRAAEL